MKKSFLSVLTLLLIVVALTSCSTTRKNHSELRGLMLLDNLELGRNRAFYSKHNVKTKRDAYRNYKKNSRYL